MGKGEKRGRACLDLHLFIIIIFSPRALVMAQNRSLFTAELIPPPPPAHEEFKKQRAQYLAQRKARQKEARHARRQAFGNSSSSEAEEPRKNPVPIKENFVAEADKTDSSRGSPLPQQESLFRAEREKYKMLRMYRRQEALLNRKMEFGSSSSDDDIPLHRRAKPTPLKMQTSPKSAFKEEDTGFGFASLDLNPLKQQKEVQSAGLLATAKLKEKKEMGRERYEVEVPSSKGSNIWTERVLQFRQNSMALGERTLPLYDISKAKMIFQQPTPAGCLRIKLTVGKQEVFLAAHPKRMNEGHFLDQYYFVFARVLAQKLQIMGRKTVQPTPIKTAVSERVTKQARIIGKVRKNSFFGGWEQQIAVVTGTGLAIYKQGKEKASLALTQGSVREIWTRFQFQRDNLILKFLNGSSKVELSVPVENFLSRDNWLYQLYSLTPK